MTETGHDLRAAREAAGISLSVLSRWTNFSKAYLGHLETGKRPIAPEHVRAYEQVLGVRVEPTECVDTADVELISQATDVVTAIGLRHGGLVAAGMASVQWKWTSSLLRQTMTDRIRLKVSGQAARLADRYAWSLADCGRTGKATKVYRQALELASESDDVRELVRVNLANHFTGVGSPRAALGLLEQVIDAPAVLHFTAHGARARAYALLGDWQATVRHVGMADDAHARVELETLPVTHRPYISGHQAHPHNEAGKALHTLAQHGHGKAVPLAVDRLEQAVSLFGPERSRAVGRCRERLTFLVG